MIEYGMHLVIQLYYGFAETSDEVMVLSSMDSIGIWTPDI